ncbi:MAG: aldose epimerase [Opitutaceae bacterium]|jgi:galactose mutarotase-like enzyme|nr:aldose epimerase [Opitutaceae bacterium]
MENVPYLGHTLSRWTVGASTFLALPEQGARLLNWNVTRPDGTVRDILHWPENAGDGPLWKTRGGNPILFPFAGRCFDHGERDFWTAPGGARLPMPMHGLARQGAFRLTRSDSHGFTARFLPGDEARAAYPFDYEFTVSYRFSSLSLACELRLANRGAAPLPWCAGHHFYFTLPWNDGLSRADYKIRVPASKTLRQDFGNGRLTPGPKLKAVEPLSNKLLSDTLHIGLKKNTAVLGTPENGDQITVSHGLDKAPPPEAVFVTWSESGTAPYYCVEPWMGPPNAPENQTGLHWVPPGQAESFLVSIAVQ